MEENSILMKDKKRELNFKKFFLMEFTKQLIKNSVPSEIFTLQTILKKEREQKIEKTREKIKEIFEERKKEVPEDQEKNLSTSAREIKGKTREIPSIMHAAIGMFRNQEIPHLNPFKESSAPKRPTRFNSHQERIRLTIPESKFPVHLQYIKPVPMNNEIELGKIDPLIKDSNVKIIECYGPEENLIVQGNMGVKKTGIILDKEEIDNTIQKFSKETRIPAQEGIFKVAIGRLIFLAIISDIVGSKFIIKKMLYEQERQPNPPIYGM